MTQKTTKLVSIIENIADERTKIQVLRSMVNTTGLSVMRNCLRHAEEQARITQQLALAVANGTPTVDNFNETMQPTTPQPGSIAAQDYGHAPRKTALELAVDYAHLYLSATDMLRSHKLTQYDEPMDINMMFDFAARTMAESDTQNNKVLAEALGTTVEVDKQILTANAVKEDQLKQHRQITIEEFRKIIGQIDEPSWNKLDEMRVDAAINLLIKLADGCIKDRIKLVVNSAKFLHLFAGEIIIKMEVAHQFMLEANRMVEANKAEVRALMETGARLRELTTAHPVVVDRRTNAVKTFNCQAEYDLYLQKLETLKKAA